MECIMNTPELKTFIKENGRLFWWTPEEEKENMSVEVVVEVILNYGNEHSVKKLFQIVGIQHVADIFYHQISGSRPNYFPQVVNFFDLYFQKYARRNPHHSTN
jgi:hypothetical protein